METGRLRSLSSLVHAHFPARSEPLILGIWQVFVTFTPKTPRLCNSKVDYTIKTCK